MLLRCYTAGVMALLLSRAPHLSGPPDRLDMGKAMRAIQEMEG